MLKGEKLGAAIEAARKKKGVTKAELAREFGVKPPSVQGWVKYGRISKDMLSNVIKYFSDVTDDAHWGIEPGDLYSARPNNVVPIKPPATDDPDIAEIRRFDIVAGMGMGNGRLADPFPSVIDTMRVSKTWLRANVSYTAIENLGLVTGLGDSMLGTFSDGDVLLVDLGVNEVKLDAVYVLSLHDELYIKRVQRRPDGSFLMISDNEKYPPYVIENGELHAFNVEGRVLLAWNARKL
ncbi:LexA family transcriptional regulator [Alloalcanivorax xenomutans]|uniref:LexA family transcriptional regulator n=1 Tax=Alloalcanivorax xenomutans TaxID=1094342 RepID=UPI0006D77E25|nr:LexA family transcriptional regulator [Alloalcanivorax xenomutans]